MSLQPDLICFSHLRWDFVWQRPQHLMTRAAAGRRVWFVEEAVDGERAALTLRTVERGVQVVQPVIPEGTGRWEHDRQVRLMVGELASSVVGPRPTCWYYTPMALPISAAINSGVVVYDCMDELTGFAGAPPDLALLERELFDRATLVFTGGRSLFEAKRDSHPSVHLFPSSVDTAHFRRARAAIHDPPDQAALRKPRIGYCGVLDERLDTALLAAVAAQRPDWEFVLVGPVVKIESSALPTARNLHYLGMKPYEALPAYLSGWDVAMLPFARNAATRFISPTKTPEYLAAGRRVVSTSIADVVDPYGQQGLAEIADTPEDFIAAVERLLTTSPEGHAARADAFLAGVSWDSTWHRMEALIADADRSRSALTNRTLPAPAIERSNAGSVA